MDQKITKEIRKYLELNENKTPHTKFMGYRERRAKEIHSPFKVLINSLYFYFVKDFCTSIYWYAQILVCNFPWRENAGFIEYVVKCYTSRFL